MPRRRNAFEARACGSAARQPRISRFAQRWRCPRGAASASLPCRSASATALDRHLRLLQSTTEEGFRAADGAANCHLGCGSADGHIRRLGPCPSLGSNRPRALFLKFARSGTSMHSRFDPSPARPRAQGSAGMRFKRRTAVLPHSNAAPATCDLATPSLSLSRKDVQAEPSLCLSLWGGGERVTSAMAQAQGTHPTSTTSPARESPQQSRLKALDRLVLRDAPQSGGAAQTHA